jgi:hypothetical protein
MSESRPSGAVDLMHGLQNLLFCLTVRKMAWLAEFQSADYKLLKAPIYWQFPEGTDYQKNWSCVT